MEALVLSKIELIVAALAFAGAAWFKFPSSKLSIGLVLVGITSFIAFTLT